jgi:hypothetical protein
MKAITSQRNTSFRMLLVILATLGFLTMSGWFIPAAHAADIPYDTNEVQNLKAFLGSQSMTPGKTNADLLGVDLSNPGTWAYWIEKEGLITLPEKHVIEIRWKSNSLAGSLDISYFTKLGYFALDCIAEVTTNFGNITIRNNPALGVVILNGVKVDELRITGNEGLGYVSLGGKVNVLTLDQPKLTALEIGTLGSSPIDLSKFSNLNILKISGINNISNWKLANYPNLKEVFLDGLGNIASINPTNCPKLRYINIDHMPDLKSIQFENQNNLAGISLSFTSIKELDLSVLPNLGALDLYFNSSLTKLTIKDKPHFQYLELKGNPALRSLEISGCDSLESFRCHYNENLEEIILKDIPKLRRLFAFSNAFKIIDISGLPALEMVWLSDNQLTEFNAEGLVLEHLDLKNNMLSEVSANVNGKDIHVKAYESGGYVGFSAYPAQWTPYGIDLDWQGLPAPYNTEVKKVLGTGLPTEGNDWKSSFSLSDGIDATFYFSADIHFINYFEKPEDNPLFEYGEGVNVNGSSIVGDPIFLPSSSEFSPSKTGFELQGWYTDSTYTHEWIFGKDTLRGELTLYPNWLPKGMPLVLSVKRQSPAYENISSDHVTYLVTFSKTVSGVDVSDFKLTTEGTVTGNIASVSEANGHAISVEVNSITGSGTLRLDVKNTETGIVDADSNPLAGGYTSGEIYSIGSVTAIDDNFQLEKSCRIFPKPTSGIIKIYNLDN